MKKIVFLVSVIAFISCSEKSSEKTTVVKKQVNSLNIKDTSYSALSSMEEKLDLKWPIISSDSKSKALDSLIYMNFNFSELTGCEIINKEDKNVFDCQITNADYKVNYNKNGVFDCSFELEYLGAHLSYDYHRTTIDLYTEKKVILNELIKDSEVSNLVKFCKEEIKSKMKHALDEALKNNQIQADESELFEGFEFEKKDLNNFCFNEDGVTIYYDFFFPHYAMAIEPYGDIFLSWNELEKYLNTELDFVKRILPAKN